MILKEDKEYLLRTHLKLLEGEKKMKIALNPYVKDSLGDIEAKIQALTNMLEML